MYWLRLKPQKYALTSHGYWERSPYLRDTMPKAKPDQVIVHRIELQEKERELAQAAIGANLAGKAIQAAGVGAGAYVAYIGVKAAYGITEDLAERFWDNTVLRVENRERYRQQAEGYNPQNPPDDLLVKTFHFWTGGIFLKDE